MRKVSLFILLFMVTSWVFAQQYTEIKGVVKMDKMPEEITLFKVEDGVNHVYTTTKVAENGSFGFLFEPTVRGFYTIGSSQANFIVYVKGGEVIHLNILDTKAELTGKNTKENVQLYKWEEFSYNLRLMSVFFWKKHSNYKDFFPELTACVAKVPDFKKRIKSGDSEFDELLKKKIGYDLDYYAMMLLRTPRAVHPKKEELVAYYNTIVSDTKFTTDDVLRLPYGISLINLYTSFAAGKFDLDKYLSLLKNDRLKGECVLMVPGQHKSYNEYLEMMDKYGKYFVTPSLKARAEAIGTKLYQSAPGKAAADFTYPDVNGKMVSLSDFKGKVVLVDVWATWCGPCRKEIPSLKKIEEEFHGKDLVVLGVSLDEVKDKKKWEEFIEKEKLGGVQVLAGGWSKIAKDYEIKGIPRFMVFDKKGNIVTINAPRPSSPDLKKLLEEELKK